MAPSARQGFASRGRLPLPRAALLLALALALGLPARSLAQPAPSLPSLASYANSATMKAGQFYFYWTTDADSIAMAVRARTQGWVGLGFSEVGAMVGSDVMVGWVAGGAAVVSDRFIFNRSSEGVALDQSQDWQALAGQEAYDAGDGSTWTTLHFRRALNTSDCNDRELAPGDHVAVIWAMGSDDTFGFHQAGHGTAILDLYPGYLFNSLGPQPPLVLPPGNSTEPSPGTGGGGSPGTGVSSTGQMAHRQLALHQSNLRGSLFQKVQVVGAQPQLQSPAQSEEWLNFTAPSFRVPSNLTTYACNAFSIDLEEKRHVVEFGVILNTTEPDSVHHLVLFSCNEERDRPKADKNYLCYRDLGCTQEFAVWAVGGRPFTLPLEAGLPVGAGGFTRFLLQVHYTNPKGRTDIVDNSGLYLKLAPELRTHDAGLLSVGPVPFNLLIAIPPGESNWSQETYCPAACTDVITANSSAGNLTVFASLLHLHTAGKQLYTELYRGGSMVASLGRQDYYDFDYQQIVDLSPGVWVLPGDELRTRCTWDTTSRTNVTLGGPSTFDEMCVNYLFYYPAIPYRVSCYNLCIFGPSNPDWAPRRNSSTNCTISPQDCSLQSFVSCGLGVFLRTNDTCNFVTQFGAESAFEPVSGCPAASFPSLDSLDLVASKVPAMPETKVPSIDPKCVAQGPDGTGTVGYVSCASLTGGFSIMWNVTLPETGAGNGSNPDNGTVSSSAVSSPGRGAGGGSEGTMLGMGGSPMTSNVTLVMRIAGEAPAEAGWIAFGFSPTGGMVGSSVIAGWSLAGENGAPGAAAVHPLFLGGKFPSQVTFGNQLSVLSSTVQAVGSNMTVYANISVPVELASQVQNAIWATGLTSDTFLIGHAPHKAYQGQVLPLNCTQSPDLCMTVELTGGASTPPASGPPPPKSATHTATLRAALVYAALLMCLLLGM